MSDSVRQEILSRLRQSASMETGEVPETTCMPVKTLGRREKIDRLKALMEAVRAEVHVVEKQHWTARLKTVLREKNFKRLLYAPETAIGAQIEDAWRSEAGGLPTLTVYAESVESFKTELFEIDAAVTTTIGAIAESGALVLWPDQREPRLMSLVPPVHIAVLEADRIYSTFCEIIQAQSWSRAMPANALLISGPSRTADIEMTVAFGVHGPRELMVFILEG